MRTLRLLLLASCLVLAAGPARAFVPQTITVDGTNDFDPSNLVTDDRLDTQKFFCTPDSVYPLDVGRIYLTNDNTYLYLGIEFSQYCFTGDNIGVAIDVNGATGGTTDPFGRKIGWASVANRPDWVVYDVLKYPGNTFNYEALYKDSLGAWYNRSIYVNPSYGSGSDGLHIADSTGFIEFKLPLSTLGISAGNTINVEWWLTQEGATKGPLDAAMSDDVQMSRVGQTTWDTTAVVQMTTMFAYSVMSAVDSIPPTVANAVAVNFPLLADKSFNLTTNKIDVTFSEPVSQVTANVAGNYAYSGPVSRTVVLAQRDASASNVVHLTLNSGITANAAFHNITVSNVQDLAGNPIVANGTTNVGSFFIQNLAFEGNFKVGLCKGIFAPTDTFSIEGNLLPLTFTICDNAVMKDLEADSIYTITVPFCMPKNTGTGRAEADLEWKFARICSEFEPLGSNRTYHLNSDNGASATLTGFWNNDDPANFTFHPVDVVFQVNVTLVGPAPSDTFFLQGNEYPLAFTPSGVLMRDDGVAPDLAAGDKIYTAQVRFPSCAGKNVEWKTYYRGSYECLTQGNRSFYLNDAAYDTVGGAMGALTLPARGIERCTVTDKAVTVVFRVDMTLLDPDPGPADTVAAMGDIAPMSFLAPPPAAAWMLDDGAGYDAAAGDHIFTRAITFPDSSNLNGQFKYWLNGTFECASIPNRSLVIDDLNYSTVTPQVRPLNAWDFCSDPTGVPYGGGVDASASFAVLRQSFPNPMVPRTTIRFELKRAGRVTLTVYDVFGRRVAKLVDNELTAGPHEAVWNGRDVNGRKAPSGVYLYELAMGGQRLSRRLVVTQ